MRRGNSKSVREQPKKTYVGGTVLSVFAGGSWGGGALEEAIQRCRRRKGGLSCECEGKTQLVTVQVFFFSTLMS